MPHFSSFCINQNGTKIGIINDKMRIVIYQDNQLNELQNYSIYPQSLKKTTNKFTQDLSSTHNIIEDENFSSDGQYSIFSPLSSSCKKNANLSMIQIKLINKGNPNQQQIDDAIIQNLGSIAKLGEQTQRQNQFYSQAGDTIKIQGLEQNNKVLHPLEIVHLSFSENEKFLVLVFNKMFMYKIDLETGFQTQIEIDTQKMETFEGRNSDLFFQIKPERI